MKKKLFFLILTIIFFSSLYSQDIVFKWKSIAGSWRISTNNEDKYLTENKIRAISWGYNDIINHNSISTQDALENYSSIQLSLELRNKSDNSEFMIFFALDKQHRGFYAFKYTNDTNCKITFINSKIKDDKLPPNVKWNFLINSFNSTDFDFEQNKKYKIEIKIVDKKAVLYIDDKKIIESETTDIINSGNIGFSSKNIQPVIREVKVFKDKTIIFEDDFSKDTIKRIVVKGKIEQIKK